MLRLLSKLANKFLSFSNNVEVDEVEVEEEVLQENDNIFSISYCLTERGTCIIDLWSSSGDFDPCQLAEFLAFTISNDGIESTVGTIKEGLDNTLGEGAYADFINHFTKITKDTIYSNPNPKTGSGRPLVGPRDVM